MQTKCPSKEMTKWAPFGCTPCMHLYRTGILNYALKLNTPHAAPSSRCSTKVIVTNFTAKQFFSVQIGYVLGLIFDLPSYLHYSLLVLACSPGGGPSNFVTVILNGDIHMSVLMTCFGNLLSIGDIRTCSFLSIKKYQSIEKNLYRIPLCPRACTSVALKRMLQNIF